MKVITQRELRNASAAVMDAVERGEAFRVTRHGTAVAELRPAGHGAFVGRGEAKAAFARVPAGGLEALRADADAVFGEDRVGG
jgi:antitoxin (DNA-binding transcriptional repressor) of toxin-antitoxin stability system